VLGAAAITGYYCIQQANVEHIKHNQINDKEETLFGSNINFNNSTQDLSSNTTTAFTPANISATSSNYTTADLSTNVELPKKPLENTISSFYPNPAGNEDASKKDLGSNDAIQKTNDKHPEKYVCKTLVFYETHNDPITTKAITELLSILKKYGYTTFYIEHPFNENIDQHIHAIEWRSSPFHKERNNQLLQLLKMIKQENLIYVPIDTDVATDNEVRDSDHYYYKNHDYHLVFFRDSFMAEKINNGCQLHKSGQVVIIGIAHPGVVHILQEQGYDIEPIYISNFPAEIIPDEYIGGRLKSEKLLREEDPEYMENWGYTGTLIIDGHKNREDKNSDKTIEDIIGFIQKNVIDDDTPTVRLVGDEDYL